MRKYFLSMLAMAAMLLTVSCSKDAAVESAANQATVAFNIATPELTTRAVGDGETANKLYWAVYDEAGKLLPNISNTTKGEGKEFTLKTNVSITLVKGKKYSFIFWAENQDGMCTIDWAGQSMTINPALANQEAYDAFWAYHKLENPVSGTINEDIFLYRPFAQLNIGTSDKAAAADAGMAVAKSQVTVATPATLDLVSGVTTGSVLCTYKFENIATIEAEDFPVDGYSYLAMNYLLVDKSEKTNPQENTIIPDLKFEYQDADGKTYEQVYYNIPVKRNYKTNIYGTLLTNEANFKVEIKPEFDGENLERWDGIEKVEPKVVDGAYRVATAAQFAWILENCKENINIVMDASIDFGGKQVPMNEYTDGNGNVINGTYRNITIEGNGNTIYNFVDEYTQTRAAGDARIAGLFPNAITATVHDLTISGAKVNAGAGESAYAGVLFGRTYGDIELKGVNIENCSVAGTNKVGGLVGFVAENTIYAYNCHVKNTNVSTNDFTSSEGEEAGLAGGLIGYIASGENEIIECTVEGGKFTVINSRGNKERANGKFIGGIGSAKVNIEGCSANVTDYTETGADNYDPYHSLVAGNRSAGTLTVDGKTFVYQSPALRDLAAQIATGVITLDDNVDLTAAASHSSAPYIEVYDDLTINGNGNDMDAGSAAHYGLIVRGGTTVVNDTNIKSQGGAVGVIGGAEVIFNSGSAYVDTASTSGRYLFYLEGEGSTVTINGGDFSWDPADNQKRAYIYAGAGTTAYVKGGNFGKASTRSGYTAGILGDGTVIITGGSFGFDPSAWVADGYKTVPKDGKWFVVDDDTDVIASDSAELQDALNNGTYVVLDGPFDSSANGTNGYGATGFNQGNGGTLDGNGNTIGVNAFDTWDSAICTAGGTIKNIKVVKGFRGIFIKNNVEKVYLDNVTIEGTTYTIHCDSGKGGGLEATNCTFNGWTSYAGTIGDVTFVNCSFGYGGGYKYCRPYAPTTFTNCNFCEGYTMDPRAAVVLENCTLNGVAITAANVSELVTDATKVTVK